VDDQDFTNIIINPDEQLPALPSDPAQIQAQMMKIMRGVADMMRATHDRMAQLEQEVRLLKPVTPAQAREIRAAIVKRAAALCLAYHVDGREQVAANAIRREIRLTHGVQSMRELPRVEYAVVMKQVELWDDYKTMKAMKARKK
jgi:hypothetical protein